MRSLPSYFRELAAPATARTAWPVALVVGTVLNLINQGAVLTRLDLATLDYWRFALNFVVPYLVASHSAAMMRLRDLRTRSGGSGAV